MKSKETYDKGAVGTRLLKRREQFGWSRSFVAGKIGITEKYYSDIERGYCGMSIETLIALTNLYGFTMDGLIYGKEQQELDKNDVLLKNLETLPPSAQDYCLQMLMLFIEGISSDKEGEVKKVLQNSGRNRA